MAEVAEQKQIGPGASLVAAREAQGLSLEQVARHLRLDTATVEAIERDECPAHVPVPFVRGYLRAYAKLIGLDADALVSAFNRKRPDEAKIVGIQNLQTLPGRGTAPKLLRWGLLLALLVVVAGAGYWVWQQQWLQALWAPAPQGLSQQVVAPVAATPAGNSGAIELGLPPDESLTATQTGDDAATTAAAADSGAPRETVSGAASAPDLSAAPTPVTDDVAPNEVAGSGSEQLDFVFVEDCWVRVMDARGEVLAIGNKKKGHRMQLKGPAPIAITLGNPQGVQLKHNNRPVDLSVYPSGRPASFSVNAQAATFE